MATIPNLTAKEFSYSIMGMLLGDGSLNKKSGRRKLVIQHGPKQEAYAIYKAEYLKQFCDNVKVYSYLRKNMINTTGDYLITEVNAWLKPHTYRHFNKFNRLYIEQEEGQVKKIVSKYFSERITPLGLLFWWMDDGMLSVRERIETRPHKTVGLKWLDRHSTLSTHSFDEKSMENVSRCLDRFGIENKIVNSYKYTIHRISTDGMKQLINTVRPYLGCVSDCMKYKFDMKYKNDIKYSPFSKE